MLTHYGADDAGLTRGGSDAGEKEREACVYIESEKCRVNKREGGKWKKEKKTV